jgi:ATP-dependent DNA helicase RecQ
LAEKEWKSVFRQMVAAGLLKVDIEGKGGFQLTPKSRPILKGEQKFLVRRDPVSDTKKISSSRKDHQDDSPLTPESEQLWENLRTLRLEVAREQNIPAYVIFHDSTLKEMVRKLPRSLGEMRQIAGIGERKLDLYGERFLAVIREYVQEQN